MPYDEAPERSDPRPDIHDLSIAAGREIAQLVITAIRENPNVCKPCVMSALLVGVAEATRETAKDEYDDGGWVVYLELARSAVLTALKP